MASHENLATLAQRPGWALKSEGGRALVTSDLGFNVGVDLDEVTASVEAARHLPPHRLRALALTLLETSYAMEGREVGLEGVEVYASIRAKVLVEGYTWKKGGAPTLEDFKELPWRKHPSDLHAAREAIERLEPSCKEHEGSAFAWVLCADGVVFHVGASIRLEGEGGRARLRVMHSKRLSRIDEGGL